jgi:hypothetical protein
MRRAVPSSLPQHDIREEEIDARLASRLVPPPRRSQDRYVSHQDIEVITPHYRGAHAAGTAGSGFRTYVVNSISRSHATTMSASHARGSRGIDELSRFLDSPMQVRTASTSTRST